MKIGREIHFFFEVNSTNEIAKDLASRRREGTVVVAVRQTEGKGRAGRRWSSPEGGLWMSIILRPTLPTETLPAVSLIAGTAVVKSLLKFSLAATAWWPNDVVVSGRKIAGILTETGFDERRSLVLGVGVNTNFQADLLPEAFRSRATSVKEELRREVSNHDLMRCICERLGRDYSRLNQGSLDELLQEWKGSSSTIGSEVEIVEGDKVLRGIARDIRSHGSLLVETEDGEVEVLAAQQCRMVE